MGDTKIRWATKVWNVVTGCDHAGSRGCDRCYARRMAARLRGRFGYPQDEPFRVTYHPDRLDWPLGWFREVVFVDSMGDLFHPDVKREWIDTVFNTMYRSSQEQENVFVILTKRPCRMADYIAHMRERDDCPMPWGDYPRIVLGTSISDQADADRFIPELLRIKDFTLAVSFEPALGAVDLRKTIPCGYYCDPDAGEFGVHVDHGPNGDLGHIGWVIVGAESGPGCRYCDDLNFVRPVVEQCAAAGVPCYVKQLHILDPRSKCGFSVSEDPMDWPAELRVREFPAWR